MSSLSDYTVADYLIDRLAELGAEHLFHVPGNYTAQFLTRAQASGKLECIGTINELEAGYAADAYSRIKPLGVVCVTYGVGSFSLYNAIAGAYVERCPVVLINGSANEDKARALVRRNVLFAHAIDTVRTDAALFEPITAARAIVGDTEYAAEQIDRVLRACVSAKKPVYLEIRDRDWLKPCPRPAGPLCIREVVPPEIQEDRETAARAAAIEAFDRIAKSQHPILWGGEELQRFGLEDQFEHLVRRSALPYTTTLLGKSLLSETASDDSRKRRAEFVGVYDSKFAPAPVKKVVENADCVLALGTILSDFYGEIVERQSQSMILVAGGAARIGEDYYPGVELPLFLEELIELYRHPPVPPGRHEPPEGFAELRSGMPERRPIAAADGATSEEMTWFEVFDPIHEFIDEGTFVVVDTTLGLFMAAELLIPKRKHFIAQTAWLSIGYSIGAAVGVSAALPKTERALILTGDGGFQMVAQAFATLVKQRVGTIVVVFDNALYGIEQFLVDAKYFATGSTQEADEYCNLRLDRGDSKAGAQSHWDYKALATALGGVGVSVGTPAELADALRDARARTSAPTLIAARVQPRSLPPELDLALNGPPPTAGAPTFGATPGEAAIGVGFSPEGFN